MSGGGIEQPADRLVSERVQTISGWIELPESALSPENRPRLLVGDTEEEIPVRFYAPGGRPAGEVRSWFFGYLFLQSFLPRIGNHHLEIRLMTGEKMVQRIQLRISPTATLSATDFPLNLGFYPLREKRAPSPGRKDRDTIPPLLLFPGLGGVGGCSLNQLMRWTLFHEGGEFPLHFEADNPAIWKTMTDRSPRPYRWIDGHYCYHAARNLGRRYARITLLRHPLKRIASVFNYGRLVHPDQFPFASLEEFALSPEPRALSQTVSLLRLAGIPLDRTWSDECLCRLAAEELQQQYALVGITEHFEETIFLLAEMAGLSQVGMWWRILAGPEGWTLDSLSDKARNSLEKSLAADMQLYEKFRGILLRQVKNSGFDNALQRYQDDAHREKILPDCLKMAEVMHWRLRLAEAQLSACRSRK